MVISFLWPCKSRVNSQQAERPDSSLALLSSKPPPPNFAPLTEVTSTGIQREMVSVPWRDLQSEIKARHESWNGKHSPGHCLGCGWLSRAGCFHTGDLDSNSSFCFTPSGVHAKRRKQTTTFCCNAFRPRRGQNILGKGEAWPWTGRLYVCAGVGVGPQKLWAFSFPMSGERVTEEVSELKPVLNV